MLGQFERVLTALVAAHVDFMVVGGVAVVMHGHLRTTKDLDLAVELDDANLVRCIECLTSLGYQPQAPVRALDFAKAPIREAWVREKNMTVFSLWHRDQLAPTVDIFGTMPFDYAAVRARSVGVMLSTAEVAVVSRADLVAMKEALGRPQDKADVLRLKELDE